MVGLISLRMADFSEYLYAAGRTNHTHKPHTHILGKAVFPESKDWVFILSHNQGMGFSKYH